MSLLLLFLDDSSEESVLETAIAFILDGITIRPPHSMIEMDKTQYSQNRVLEGDINRDYFGDGKRVWRLDYSNLNSSDYDILRDIYDDYLATGEVKTWEVTGDSYSVSPTEVHIDLPQRKFSEPGLHFISDFSLTLVEA